MPLYYGMHGSCTTWIVVPCVLMRLMREGTAKYQYFKNDEIVYSVGSDCTNLNQCWITVSFNLRQTPFYAVLRDSGYSGPIVADTDTLWQQQLFHRNFLHGLLCIMRKQETILCRNLVPEEMADCNWMSCQLKVL